MKETLKQISNLVDRLENNVEAYRNDAHNKTQLRIKSIDPFLEPSNWNGENETEELP